MSAWKKPVRTAGTLSWAASVPGGRGLRLELMSPPDEKTKRLAGKQAELCQTQPEIVSEVAKGARLGVRECQYQFRYRRWNCTSHNKYFGKVLQQGGDISSSRKPLPPGTLAAQLSVPAVRTGFFQADNCNARSKDVHEAILIRQDKGELVSYHQGACCKESTVVVTKTWKELQATEKVSGEIPPHADAGPAKRGSDLRKVTDGQTFLKARQVSTTLTQNMLSLKTTLTQGMLSLKTTLTQDMLSLKTTLTQDMLSLKTTLTQDMLSLKTTLTQDMLSLKTTLTQDMLSLKTTLTQDMLSLKTTLTQDMLSLKTTLTQDMLSLKTTLTQDMLSLKTTLTQDMLSLNTTIIPAQSSEMPASLLGSP
ncbi:hypothetical protein CRUP_008402 [Coryphaenoides rupestris]|nr:hypothetical protein CRUP_008402 [Coryphaenoides rupestris]